MPDGGDVQRAILPIPDQGATQPFIFSADEGVDVGCEFGTTVSPDAAVEDSTFTGGINWVELIVGHDDQSHRIDPADHISVLIARQ
jgi:hypothetical protein